MMVIAAYLQDAAVPVEDMVFRPGGVQAPGDFVMVVQRFRWEGLGADETPADGGRYERVLCGITFRGVHRARLSGIDLKRDRDDVLDLLTVSLAGEAGAARIDLVFAGDKAVRLDVARPDCVMEDYGQPWPTLYRPRHPGAGQ